MISNTTSNPDAPDGKAPYMGLARLMRRSLAGENLAPLGQAMIEHALAHPDDADALMDTNLLMQMLGQPDTAMYLLNEALKLRRGFCLPAQQPVKLRLLALMAPGTIMANAPIECLLENSDIELHYFYTTGEEPDWTEIPEHDVLFVAIGVSEVNRPILDAWTPWLAVWPRPVLIDPQHILRLARDTAARLMQAVPGVLMPPTQRVHRAELEAIVNGAPEPQSTSIALPLVIRPLDSHAGNDLYKIDTPEALAASLAALPGDAFFVAPFIDYRSEDGQFRKYRIILVDGTPFACHMGISSHWMIHYLNAGMADSQAKREEEARFMADFAQDFAVRHAEALSGIHQVIGLEYLGIDCAETKDGRLLIFEVDHAMVVHAMDPVDVYPYKPAAMQKIFDAFRGLLIKAAARTQPTIA